MIKFTNYRLPENLIMDKFRSFQASNFTKMNDLIETNYSEMIFKFSRIFWHLYFHKKADSRVLPVVSHKR